ncbi:flagellin [Aurantimonas sp. VKM B-3413]|uniref:flagellin N-terminal helical domain-containing protein n=1 Tax=Aurantimonas sp. VKM B-3413 TaxID=2779401 RepID=UPI001E58E619|nr:flagellin [Aurantimonas sp. VKM B-3413]MCB8835871.1 flagellin C [Aurantimonas sp. VKM B-3413]
MSSLMTNTAAMTALQTLALTNTSLEETQNAISTGYRVADAKDNAAYWSISTTMRSDNKAMSAVKDSLGIGSATVDTAYTGLDSAKDVLNEIKAKLTAATQDGVDRTKIQDEISQLQEQLKSIADSASFSGQNWLSIDSSASGYNASKSIVANFARDASGALSLGSITVDTSKLTLYDANSTSAGILNGGVGGNTSANGVTDGTNTAATATAATVSMGSSTTGLTLDVNDTISFDVAIGTGTTAKVVTIDQALVNSTLGVTDGKIAGATAMASVMNAALTAAGVAASATASTAGALSLSTTATGTGTTITVSNTDADAGTAVSTIDITGASITAADIKKYIGIVDDAISKVTAGASTLGAIQNRIDLQTTFVSDLMDTIDKGVGTLVDADMTEESTRLKALQTQQQLGVQALSIANSSSQTLLSLFK